MQATRATRRPLAIAAMVVASLLTLNAATARADLPGVMQHLPDDAAIAIVVPSISQSADNVAMMSRRLQLPMEELNQPLAFLQESLGIRQGLAADRSAAFLMLDMPQNPRDEPRMAFLLPVSDYQQFLGNFDAQGNDGVQAITFADHPSFIREVGEFALIGGDRETVEGFQPADDQIHATRIGAAGIEAADGSDLFAVINLEMMGEMFLEQMQQEMQMQRQLAPPEAAAILDLYQDVAEEIFTSGTALVSALGLSEDGIALSSSVQFREGTAAADALAQGPEQRPRLNRLPNRDYLIAATWDFSTLPLEQWIDHLQQTFAGDDEFSVMMRQMVAQDPTLSERGQMFFDPELGFGGNVFNGVSVVLTDDPQAALAAFREQVEALDGLEMEEEVSYVTAWQENAVQVDGRDVHRYSIRMEMPPEAMAELGPFGAFLLEDMGGYVVTTDDALISTTGGDITLLEQTLALGQADPTLDDATGIDAMRQFLHTAPALEAYLSVASVLETVNEFLVMFDPGAQIPVPDDLPPLGMSMSINEGGAGSRIFVPMQIIDTTMQMFQQMGGPPPGFEFGLHTDPDF